MHPGLELAVEIGAAALLLPLWMPVASALAEELRAALAEERASRAWRPVDARGFRDSRGETGELYGQLLSEPRSDRVWRGARPARLRERGAWNGARGNDAARRNAYTLDPEERRRREATRRGFSRAA